MYPSLRLLLLGSCAALTTVGCGSQTAPPDFGGEDGKQIAALVDRLNDDAGRVKEYKEIFASGSVPSSREGKRFAGFEYTIVGTPTVTGQTATAKVSLTPFAGGEPKELDWTFVKDGSGWKIKSAPLP